MFRGRVRHVHFIGVGGIGMSGLAEILRTLEFDVSGSDMKEGETTARLKRLGVRIDVGHRAENVGGADVVVYSSAIRPENPEIVQARHLGIPVIPRAEMLAELMRVKYGVAIAGSHGKTTTTSLVATILGAAGFDPTVVVGGRMHVWGTNAKLGAGDLLVAEADESDGSFLRLTPTIATITNIDAEHLDFYKTYDAVKEAFVQFVQKVPFYGLGVLCLDHPAVQELLPRVGRRHVTYGLSPQADYSARAVGFHKMRTSFVAYKHGKALGEFTVQMPGQHNVLNCLAAIAVADELEVPLDVMKESLATFRGVARRFTIVAEVGGVSLIDDYGHHPAEVVATLAAARKAFDGRVIVAFQPHRHTRTHHLFDEFTRAFNECDRLFLLDIYAAGESPIPGVSSEQLAHAVARHGHHAVSYVHDRATLARALADEARPGDCIIALGAGDVNKVLREVEVVLASRRVAAKEGQP
jgi:UDP-N-acetylmuramate--alanine ligase